MLSLLLLFKLVKGSADQSVSDFYVHRSLVAYIAFRYIPLLLIYSCNSQFMICLHMMQFSPQFQVVSTGTPRTSWPWRQIPPPHYSRSFGADPPCCRCVNCTWLSTLTKSMPTFSGEVYRVGSRLGLTAAILSTHIRGTMSQPSKTSCCPELHC